MLTALFSLLEALAFTLLLQAASSPFWGALGNSFPAQLAAWLIYGLLAGLLAFAFGKVLRGTGLRALGFRYYRSFWSDVWLGLVAYAVEYLISLPLDLVALPSRAKMVESLVGQMNLTGIPQILAVGGIIFIGMGFITGAFHEEIRFRGYYQGVACGRLDPVAGFMIALIPFSLGHASSNRDWSTLQVCGTVIPGIVYGLLYYATGSLTAVMTTHTLSNWIGAYPALFQAARKNPATGIWSAVILAVPFLVLVWLRRNREIRELATGVRKMFSGQPVRGLLTGMLIGGVLLAAWFYRLPAPHASLGGLALFAVCLVAARWRR